MELEGRVVKRLYASGTKSEREAVFLESTEGTFLLRRAGGNPFELDPELQELIGRKVRCAGFVSRDTFFCSHCVAIGEDES